MEWLQAVLNFSVGGNTVRAYALAALALVALVAALLLAQRVIVGRCRKWAARTANEFDDFLAGLLGQVGPPFFVALALYAATAPLHLPAPVRTALRTLLVVVVVVRAVLLLQAIARYAIHRAYRRGRPADAGAESVARNLTLLAQWTLWAFGALCVLGNLGVNISALVAGLGIGGVALALAAQTVLGDLFSALAIFIDKPFEVGDFILVDNLMGTVEYVGLKTTRIRSLSGEQLIFTNSDLTRSRIQNYKRMETRRIVFRVGVVYETPLAQAQKIPGLVRGVFENMAGVRLDRVHCASFGDFALNYEIVYYVLSPDYNVYMDKQQAINFALLAAFEQAGLTFAYPTQTLYLAGPGRPGAPAGGPPL